MMGTDVEDPLEECSVLEVGEKDTLLLRSTRPLSAKQRQQLESYFHGLFPANKVIILDETLTLDIIHQAWHLLGGRARLCVRRGMGRAYGAAVAGRLVSAARRHLARSLPVIAIFLLVIRWHKVMP